MFSNYILLTWKNSTEVAKEEKGITYTKYSAILTVKQGTHITENMEY